MNDPYIPGTLFNLNQPPPSSMFFDQYHGSPIALAWSRTNGRLPTIDEMALIRGAYVNGWRDGVGRTGVLLGCNPWVLHSAVGVSDHPSYCWDPEALKRLRDVRPTESEFETDARVRRALWPE